MLFEIESEISRFTDQHLNLSFLQFIFLFVFLLHNDIVSIFPPALLDQVMLLIFLCGGISPLYSKIYTNGQISSNLSRVHYSTFPKKMPTKQTPFLTRIYQKSLLCIRISFYKFLIYMRCLLISSHTTPYIPFLNNLT